jgi:hypothetical protein
MFKFLITFYGLAYKRVSKFTNLFNNFKCSGLQRVHQFTNLCNTLNGLAYKRVRKCTN